MVFLDVDGGKTTDGCRQECYGYSTVVTKESAQSTVSSTGQEAVTC